MYVLMRGVYHLLLMFQGGYLRKYGRYGKPKQHWFRLSHDDRELLWDSSNVSRAAEMQQQGASSSSSSNERNAAIGRQKSSSIQREWQQL